jgi:predicted N-acetyltransferase YhbS
MMSTPTLRPATPDDAPLLRDIIVTAFEPYRGKLVPPSGAHSETPQTIAGKLELGGGFIAYAGDEAVGAVLYELREGYGYLGRLAVLPAQQHGGIGRTLAQSVEDAVRAAGLPAVQLGVRTGLAGNVAFFEGLGYRVISSNTHPGYTEPTFLTLRKDLEAE